MKKIGILFVSIVLAVMMMLGGAGCDAVVKELREEYQEEWQRHVRVSVEFPREVKQGESFVVTVTTKNPSNKDIEYWCSSTVQNLGVYVERIIIHSDEVFDGSWYPIGWGRFVINDDDVAARIKARESVEYRCIFETQIPIDYYDFNYFGHQFPYRDIAPIGLYDIYLSNGEIYRNAIRVV